MSANSEFTKIANYHDANTAEHILSILKDSEIEGFLDGAHTQTALSYVGVAIGGVNLYVRNDDVDSANAILAEIEVGIDKTQPAWFCGACSEVVEGGFEVCWSCGKPRAEVEMDMPSTAESVDAEPATVERDNFSSAAERDSNPFAAPHADVQQPIPPREPPNELATESIEKLLWRAMAAAIASLIVPVLPNLISAYYMIRAIVLPDPWSKRCYRYLVIACLFNVVIIAIWVAVFYDQF
ncbi:MAG: DUF2007 domain-containing protein [Planctomycetota bacterium]